MNYLFALDMVQRANRMYCLFASVRVGYDQRLGDTYDIRRVYIASSLRQRGSGGMLITVK